MKKGLAFLLALLMLCPMLLACGDTAVGETTGAATETVATTDPNAPDVPAELTADVSGDFTILVAGNYTRNDFQAEADAQTVVEAAIYRRNETLKEKFGVNVINEDITKFGSATGSVGALETPAVGILETPTVGASGVDVGPVTGCRQPTAPRSTATSNATQANFLIFCPPVGIPPFLYIIIRQTLCQ